MFPVIIRAVPAVVRAASTSRLATVPVRVERSWDHLPAPQKEKVINAIADAGIVEVTPAERASPGFLKKMGEMIKNNKIMSLVALMELSQAGYDIYEWWAKDSESDPPTAGEIALVESWRNLNPGRVTSEDMIAAMRKIREVGESSKLLGDGLSPEGKTMRNTHIAVLKWAKDNYGGIDLAIRAHDMHQAFFEMSHDAVVDGFTHLKLS